jgi:hypothetical protein
VERIVAKMAQEHAMAAMASLGVARFQFSSNKRRKGAGYSDSTENAVDKMCQDKDNIDDDQTASKTRSVKSCERDGGAATESDDKEDDVVDDENDALAKDGSSSVNDESADSSGPKDVAAHERPHRLSSSEFSMIQRDSTLDQSKSTSNSCDANIDQSKASSDSCGANIDQSKATDNPRNAGIDQSESTSSTLDLLMTESSETETCGPSEPKQARLSFAFPQKWDDTGCRPASISMAKDKITSGPAEDSIINESNDGGLEGGDNDNKLKNRCDSGSWDDEDEYESPEKGEANIPNFLKAEEHDQNTTPPDSVHGKRATPSNNVLQHPTYSSLMHAALSGFAPGSAGRSPSMLMSTMMTQNVTSFVPPSVFSGFPSLGNLQGAYVASFYFYFIFYWLLF